MQRMHRYLYQEKYGEIDDRIVVRHKCDNPSCINIEHLETGTQEENMKDMVARGRSANKKGEKQNNSKLTDEQARQIRNDLESPSRELAKKYNVSIEVIRNIRNGHTWKHVGDVKKEIISPTKLTRDQVNSIREEYSKGGISQYKLAEKYKVTQTQISNIIRNKSWRDEEKC